MNQLIKITEKEGKQLVSARELHEFLESGQDFTTWIKNRIEKYGFVENEDFTLHKFMVGKAWKHDYALTIEMAKELSMVENNEKGSQARKYFIQCEKELKENVQAPKQLSAMDQIKLQNQALIEINEKVDNIDERTKKLEDNMTIDYGQQLDINNLAKKKVVAILGGKDTPAYKELNKKAFSQIWKDYKRMMQVNSYKNTAVKDIDIARKVIIDWKPNRELELMIKGCNAQIRM